MIDQFLSYIIAYGEYNFKQVNVIGIQILHAQLLAGLLNSKHLCYSKKTGL